MQRCSAEQPKVLRLESSAETLSILSVMPRLNHWKSVEGKVNAEKRDISNYEQTLSSQQTIFDEAVFLKLNIC